MNATLAKIVVFAAGLLTLLFTGGALSAATPACHDAAIPCSSQLNTRKVEVGRFHVAQVPSMSESGPKVVINQPKKDIPRKAFKALDKHCARCHQQGRLERAKPAKSFGNILKLDEIASDPHLILPGNPDGSRLFSRIVKQEMPYDVYTEFSGGNEPNKDDVQAIYDWIESLGANAAPSCNDRKPVDTEKVVADISAHLKKQAAGRREGMRYLTLTNFYNACASGRELGRMHNGVKLLLNSLSRAPRTTRTTTIGNGGSIIAVSLDDLGWSPEDWKTLVAVYPYGVRPKSRGFDQIKTQTKTALPYLRADWFAAAASSPPLYYKLLNLPEDLVDLQSELGVDAEQNIANGDVMRAGIGQSSVSRYNRIAERHAIGEGYLWMTYDFDGAGSDQSAKKRPLGPGGDNGFRHDMNAVIFSLPNGMNAFYLGDEDGKRIDVAPPDVLHDESTPRRPVIAGLSCMSCHTRGVREIVDDVRAHVETSNDFSQQTRDEALRIYVAQGELDRRTRDDRKQFSNAAANADITLQKGDDGLDDLSYLVGRYNRNIDIRIVAAEYGVSKNSYASGIAKGDEEARRTRQQLEQGTMARRALEPLFLKHVALVSADVPAGQVKAPDKRPAKPPLAAAGTAKKPVKKSPVTKKNSKPATGTKVAATTPGTVGRTEGDETITLVSDKSRYRMNDLPVFTVKSSSDCELTLINVGPTGQATVIFPNKYQQENAIRAKREFKFPGADAPFQFRLTDPGKEKLIAECSVSGNGDRIQHNFEQQEFTDLGDYRDHVGEQAETEGEKKKSAGATGSQLLRTAITFSVN